jgi:hypothetical protein
MPLKVAGENGKTRLSYILKGLVLAAKEESKVAFIGFPVPAVRSLREAINFFEQETEGWVVMPAAHYEPFIKKSKHSSRFVVSTVDDSGNSPHWAPTHGADIFDLVSIYGLQQKAGNTHGLMARLFQRQLPQASSGSCSQSLTSATQIEFGCKLYLTTQSMLLRLFRALYTFQKIT